MVVDWKIMSAAGSLKLFDGSLATGFVLRRGNIRVLITPKHAVYKNDGTLYANGCELVQPTDVLENKYNHFNIDFTSCIIKTHPVYDICMIHLQEHIDGKFTYSSGVEPLNHDGKSLAMTTDKVIFIKDLNLASEIFIVGYPTSLGLKQSPQFNYNQPLLKKGIISNVDIPRKTIILDSSVYHGNSGSPVLMPIMEKGKWRMYCIGMIIQSIPYIQKWHNIKDNIINEEHHNSNYCVAISFDAIFELLKEFD